MAARRSIFVASLLAGLACSDIDSRSIGFLETDAGSGGAAPAGGGSQGGDLAGGANPGVTPAGGGMGSTATMECESIGLVPSPADLLLLLDTSASMLDIVEGSDAVSSPPSKWDVVRQALEA